MRLLGALSLQLALRFAFYTARVPTSTATDAAAGPDDECGLYVVQKDSVLSLYTGKAVTRNSPILPSSEELAFTIIDANKNEYSPWHDLAWDTALLPTNVWKDRDDKQDLFVSGPGAMAQCADEPNLQFASEVRLDTESDGSSSNIMNFKLEASSDLKEGEMLTMECNMDTDEDDVMLPHYPLSSLKQHGVCLDTLSVKNSQVAGRGAFAKHKVPKGGIIAISPVNHMDRSQIEVVKQERKSQHRIPLFRDHGIEYQASQVIGQQLMLNYCYGSKKSNVLLLPMAPGVNFINHSSKEHNAKIRWSSALQDGRKYREELPAMELFEMSPGILALEYVAVRDIQPGEEILIDYGPAWETAWNNRDKDEPFRHEIGVPDGLYPNNWNKIDPQPYGDFIASPLPSGHMAPIRWKKSAKVVTPWAFRIGIHDQVQKVLLEYCNHMGITDILRHVTVEGNGLEPGTETHLDLQDDDWYLQRPAENWRSNLHWFSPGAGPAHEHYLQALSVAGFDEILDGIGQYLGMDGLVAFHVTFIGVSHSTRGYLHHDVEDTDGKVFNVIVPLILANETGPELDLLDDSDDSRVGRYRYELGVGSMMGDSAYHASSACDYRNTKEMRMAATVYVADVNDDNIKDVMNHYTQAYPPRDINLLNSWRARHWKKDDPSRSLPKPVPGHILFNYSQEQAAELAGDEMKEGEEL